VICEDTTMAGLPLDLLDQICLYLDFISLLNFSLADKQCNSAANRHNFARYLSSSRRPTVYTTA
jgi:hypothetical protein